MGCERTSTCDVDVHRHERGSHDGYESILISYSIVKLKGNVSFLNRNGTGSNFRVSHRCVVYHHAYANMDFAITGENMVRHSVSLVKVKDPFMKRSGASRLTMIATDGESLLKSY